MGGKPAGESGAAGAVACPTAASGERLKGGMLRLLIDENFNQRILRGLRLRLPSLDYVVVQETDMQGLQDAPLLQEAAVAAGEPMPGIIAVPDDLPIGQAIEQLHIVVECSGEHELENQVLYLPL